MKKIILGLTLLTSTFGFSQLTGDLATDARPITSEIPFTKEMNREGVLVFDIVVDRKGKVTSCEIDKVKSTINSERYAYEAKNSILVDLKFEAGNNFPPFHRGTVTIKAVVE